MCSLPSTHTHTHTHTQYTIYVGYRNNMTQNSFSLLSNLYPPNLHALNADYISAPLPTSAPLLRYYTQLLTVTLIQTIIKGLKLGKKTQWVRCVDERLRWRRRFVCKPCYEGVQGFYPRGGHPCTNWRRGSVINNKRLNWNDEYRTNDISCLK
jgi:hypothetical protein